MTLFQEYQNQHNWRGWERYLSQIPLRAGDTVVDLGCSLGVVSHLFSCRVKQVVGVDVNFEFIEYCNTNRQGNEHFLCTDFLNLDSSIVESCDGVWSSFSLSYLQKPSDFLAQLYYRMNKGSWIALVDVSCFISGNLRKSSPYYESANRFEIESYQSDVYDFNFGSKMQGLLESAGFDITYEDHDVEDAELNFQGAASNEVLEGWESRLHRLEGLKNLLGDRYPDFCSDFLEGLNSRNHEKRGNVRFVVGRKV